MMKYLLLFSLLMISSCEEDQHLKVEEDGDPGKPIDESVYQAIRMSNDAGKCQTIVQYELSESTRIDMDVIIREKISAIIPKEMSPTEYCASIMKAYLQVVQNFQKD